jgi:hypothetical protein
MERVPNAVHGKSTLAPAGAATREYGDARGKVRRDKQMRPSWEPSRDGCLASRCEISKQPLPALRATNGASGRIARAVTERTISIDISPNDAYRSLVVV